MTHVLVIGAHPDDETLGAGGTILKHRAEGDEVTVLIVTDGVTARHDRTEMQQGAAINACARLGVSDVRFGGLPDQRLDELPLLKVIDAITRVVRDVKPSIVYTHHGGDVNQDHRVIFNATLVAARPVNGNPVRSLYSYEVASSTEWAPPFEAWQFKPNVYVDITPFVDRKTEAAAAYADTYRTEIPPYPHPRSLRAIQLYANRRGIEVGMEAAEAFALVRHLG
jgi:N-acetylglucosamine malate deacetylase 1